MPDHNSMENVAAMLSNLRSVGCPHCTLYAYRQELGLSSKRELPTSCRIVTTFDRKDIEDGCTPEKWNYIFGSILQFHQKGYLK